MAYYRILAAYPPYARSEDPRGFLSKRYGGGHSGLDSVGNLWNQPVCAVCDGTVERIYRSDTLGNVVEFGNAHVRAAYYHLASVAVITGQRVEKDQTILGTEGNTGSASKGKHLHVSLWIDGRQVDPEPYFSGEKQWTEEPMKYSIGDTICVTGKVAASAYNKSGSLAVKDRKLTVTAVYPGTNFPYQCGATGFVREADIRQEDSTAELQQEMKKLRKKLNEAEDKLKSIREILN